MSDIKADLASKVQDAFHSKRLLRIEAGNSKHFYGRKIKGDVLSVLSHDGISELKI